LSSIDEKGITAEEVTTRVQRGLSAIPDLGKLLFRLVRDPRVPRKNKLIFMAIGGYLFLPFDVIPDWIPGIGQLDDLVLIVLALDALVNRVPEEILREHWQGDEDILMTIRRILGFASNFVPDRIKDRLFAGEEEEF
jgi:uncharacterized membrane protein YkvA (DUF1232 family)